MKVYGGMDVFSAPIFLLVSKLPPAFVHAVVAVDGLGATKLH
jgi:hypothetical protein